MVIVTLLSLVLTSTPSELDTAGRTEFESGVRFFRDGDYHAALSDFQVAYERSEHRPSVIFALAQCERALGMLPLAIEHFEEFLATRPTEAEARSVRATIATLRKEQASRAEAPPEVQPERRPIAPAAAPPPAAVPRAIVSSAPEAGDTRWAWWVGAGVAVLGVSAAIVAASLSTAEPYGGTTGIVLDPAR